MNDLDLCLHGECAHQCTSECWEHNEQRICANGDKAEEYALLLSLLYTRTDSAEYAFTPESIYTNDSRAAMRLGLAIKVALDGEMAVVEGEDGSVGIMPTTDGGVVVKQRPSPEGLHAQKLREDNEA